MEKENKQLIRLTDNAITRANHSLVKRGLTHLHRRECRVINFPSQFSIGILGTVDANGSDFWWDQKWEKLGEAIGEVQLPSSKKLGLEARERKVVINNPSADSADFFTDLLPLAKLNFDDLQALDLSGVSFRDLSIRDRQARSNYLQHLTGLEWISMRENKVNDDDLSFLSKMESLQYLDLSDTEVTGYALYGLKNSKLRELCLNTTNVGEVNGLGFLHCLPYLEKLDLGGNNEVTINCLYDLSTLTNLKELVIDFVYWDNFEIKELDDALPPGCEIIQR